MPSPVDPSEGLQWLRELAPLAVLFTSVGAVLAQFLSSFFSRKTTEAQQLRDQLSRRVSDLELRLDTERRSADETIDRLRTESDRMRESYERRLEDKQRAITDLELQLRKLPYGGN